MLSTWRLRSRSIRCSLSDRSSWRARSLLGGLDLAKSFPSSWDSRFHSRACFLLQYSTVSIENLSVLEKFSCIWILLPTIIIIQNFLTRFIDLFSDLFLRHRWWQPSASVRLPSAFKAPIKTIEPCVFGWQPDKDRIRLISAFWNTCHLMHKHGVCSKLIRLLRATHVLPEKDFAGDIDTQPSRPGLTPQVLSLVCAPWTCSWA